MSAPRSGLVGRMVSLQVTRGDVRAAEVCEVVACQAAGEYGYWRILVATHDGALLSTSPGEVTLVAELAGDGPYR